jgi:hypothetical protein
MQAAGSDSLLHCYQYPNCSVDMKASSEPNKMALWGAVGAILDFDLIALGNRRS